MVTSRKVATSASRGKLQEVQRICVDVGETLPTTTSNIIELCRDNIKKMQEFDNIQ